jgi:hypothetical protein
MSDWPGFTRLGLHLADFHLAGEAVERQPVAFLQRGRADPHRFRAFVDLQRARPDHRRLAHLPADDRRVRGHAARRGENALCDEHPVNVVRHRLLPDQHDALALTRPLDGVIGRKDDLPGRRAR